MPHVTQLRRLEIGRRTVLTGDGTAKLASTVFCPIRESSVPPATCERCPRLHRLEVRRSGGTVECDVPVRDLPLRMDLAETAARIAIGDVMRRDVVAVTTDVALETLVTLLLEATDGCAPVVDAQGGVVGLITMADLLRFQPESGISDETPPRALGNGFHIDKSGSVTARDVMTGCVHVLPDHARLSHAIGLLASERVGHVPIVDAVGVLVGVLDRADVMDWLAAEMGYEPRGVGTHRKQSATST